MFLVSVLVLLDELLCCVVVIVVCCWFCIESVRWDFFDAVEFSGVLCSLNIVAKKR